MPHPDVPLARTLGLGAMIGARIFVLTGMGAGEPGQQQPRRRFNDDGIVPAGSGTSRICGRRRFRCRLSETDAERLARQHRI